MKLIYLLFLVTLSTTLSFSQDELYKQPLKISEDGIVEFSEVVQKEGASASELYNKAREWFADAYKSADDVLQMEDEDNKKLVGKAISTLDFGNAMAQVEVRMYYTIKIYCKDGRYKYIITDIRYEAPGNQYNGYKTYNYDAEDMITDDKLYKKNGKPKAAQKRYKEKTISSVNRLVENLKSDMDKDVSSDTDDW